MRHSEQRELIYGILKESCAHPTADGVFEEARKIMPDISLGTVYRNLKLLAEEGKIETLETMDKSVHYDGDISSHGHFICTHCGKIYDIFEQKGLPEALKTGGFTVDNQKNVFYGICPECNKKIKNN